MRKERNTMMNTPQQIAELYAEAGVFKTKLSTCHTLLLAFFAGMFIAFGAVGSQIASCLVTDPSAARMLSAVVFPVGLLMVLIAGAELFTGNCLLTLSCLDKRIKVSAMLRNWGLVYLGNFLGGVFLAWMLTYSHTLSLFDGKLAQLVVNTATTKVHLSFSDAFLRGILCNLLVCLAVWISFAAKDVTGKVVGMFFPTMVFVLSGYEHCIANMYFIPAGLFTSAEYGIAAEGLTWGAFFIQNLIPVTLGNILGGAMIGAGYYLVYLNKKKGC